ncbi:MAG TPA: DUF3261 domain-containing protein [Polyangiales bacterium]|nr:DUF3261 domain-containing protein [Polyangiales bacterium]
MKKLALALLLAACAPKAGPTTGVPQFSLGGVLISTDQITAEPFVVQQHIKGVYQGGDVTIDCVVQFKDKKLTVLGLTPFGTRAFSIEQEGVQVKFEKYVERDMPVQPEMVLYDIHRVFFRKLPPGQSRGQDHSDQVTELQSGDYVIERRFESMEGPANLVVITFDGPPAPIVAPHVTIANTAFAYSLEIENSEQKSLGNGYTLEVQTDGTVPTGPLPPPEALDPEAPQADPSLYTPPSAD